jgi:hypothetical protein
MAKLVTCNRCGEQDLFWTQTKTGKFYLAETATYKPGGSFIGHKCQEVAIRLFNKIKQNYLDGVVDESTNWYKDQFETKNAKRGQ